MTGWLNNNAEPWLLRHTYRWAGTRGYMWLWVVVEVSDNHVKYAVLDARTLKFERTHINPQPPAPGQPFEYRPSTEVEIEAAVRGLVQEAANG